MKMHLVALAEHQRHWMVPLLCAVIMVFWLAADVLRSPQQCGGRQASGAASPHLHTPAARALVPLLQQRPQQVSLMQRWGLPTAGPSWVPAPHDRVRIPRILHHVYMPSVVKYLESTAEGSNMREEWAQSCPIMHPGWEYVFWDEDAARQLISTYYPDYLELFEDTKVLVRRSDLMRIFILHAVGGLYLDTDIECWRPGDQFLEDADVVLQGSYAGLTNGVMASMPGHPMWEEAMQRAAGLWRKSKEGDGKLQAFTFGPPLLNKVFASQVVREQKQEQSEGGSDRRRYAHYTPDMTASRTAIRVYPKEAWYTVCKGDDMECQMETSLELAVGVAPLNVYAGHHRHSASWLGPNREGLFSVEGFRQAVCTQAG